MRRISAIFIAVCMLVVAASIGGLLYLGLKLDGRTSAMIGLAALVVMALYHAIGGRLRDRGELSDRLAELSRGGADLGRQMAEISRRLSIVENRTDKTATQAPGADDPLAVEIGELGTLVRQIADTVASHAALLEQQGAPAANALDGITDGALTLGENNAAGGRRFRSLSREAIVELIRKAADANRIDLYLQPVVTLPQRKVRYHEALSRLRTEEGDVIAAGDFIEHAEKVGLMPKIDNLLLFRCVQVTRRLQLKTRDVGLFCNVSAATLSDAAFFRQFLEFMDANRALNNALMFEFTQSAYRAFGPIEHESLAALSELGFRFSMDHVTDLRVEPKELADRAFRFLKVPAKLLLNPAANAQNDIHPGDLADLLARSGVDLIAERIESESMVVDLLDYDVRFGQGFLFSPPRPVRIEALQGGPAAEAGKPAAEARNELAAAGAASG